MLAPQLASQGVTVVRESVAQGAPIAVLDSDLPAVHRALFGAASSRPNLQVRLYRQHKSAGTLAIGLVTVRDLESADWFQIGSTKELTDYRIETDGFLTVLVVRHDLERNRYLTLHQRARRVDWTEMFDRPRDDRSPIPMVIGRPRPHPCAPLDVVYTWVDSSDAAWREAYATHRGEFVAANASADNEERYIDRAELRYSLRSIWMFVPFVRHIYIVTADQRPSWLGEHPQVSVVSHREIFPSSSMLPTFNSHAIEACLHRIPGLSENFLYFNDDVFVGREIAESDLFTMAGLAKVRLSPSAFIYGGAPEPGAIPTDWAAYNSVGLVQRDFELTFNRRLQHVPHPLKKSVLGEIEQRYPDEIRRTREARFRSTTDVALPSMLAQYYAIATGRAVEWPPQADEYVYLNTGRADAHRQYSTIMRRRPKFFCLNVTRYDEFDLAEQERQLTVFLQTAFPVAAPWEIDRSDGAPVAGG